MHHYRQALLRMRQGDSDRDIAAARVMGRPKAAQWRRIASERGWLDTAQPLPDDETIAAALGAPRKASSTISTLGSHRDEVGSWTEQVPEVKIRVGRAFRMKRPECASPTL